MESIVLVVALIVSIFTLSSLVRLLRELNAQLPDENAGVTMDAPVDEEKSLEDLEAQMERLEKLDKLDD